MKIGIDARLIEETGVGRYIRNLISELGMIDKNNDYVVFLKKNAYDTFKLPNARWQKRLADISWHSFTEQILMPVILAAEKLDLLHVPYFNVPIFYPRKFIVTIHDLTILHFDTGKATTLPWFLYKIRRAGYHLALFFGLFRAQKILAVSEATKKEIVDHFHIAADKIVVTYEGVDNAVINDERKMTGRLIKDPYFLYVGNAYPHKNLEILLKAFQLFMAKNSRSQFKLVLVGPDDYFYRRLSEAINATKLSYSIKMLRSVKEEELRALYKNSEALVFPSLMEGFGLPGLEAMAAGIPVVCSEIPVFREIYGDAAVYFNPKDSDNLAQKLELIIKDQKLRQKLIEKGEHRLLNYNWQRLARETLTVYKEAGI